MKSRSTLLPLWLSLWSPSRLLSRASIPFQLTIHQNQSEDQNIGSATQQQSTSASSLLSTLAPVAVVAFVWLIVFVIVRPRAGWKYAPRSQSKMLPQQYVHSNFHTRKNADTTYSLYTPSLPSGKFNWLSALWAIPDTFVLTHQSLDSYLFLRFLKLSVVACLVGCCITWPILFPVNATGGAGQHQLDVLTMSNVDSPWRFFAHAGCAWLYFGESLTTQLTQLIYLLTAYRLLDIFHHPREHILHQPPTSLSHAALVRIKVVFTNCPLHICSG